jgi:hypothetical protein
VHREKGLELPQGTELNPGKMVACRKKTLTFSSTLISRNFPLMEIQNKQTIDHIIKACCVRMQCFRKDKSNTSSLLELIKAPYASISIII